MDFIERMFGASPDGGNGSLEFVILIAGVLIAMVVAWGIRSKRFYKFGRK